MADISMPKASAALATRRHALAPQKDDAFLALSKAVFADGALDKRTKQLIAVYLHGSAVSGGLRP